jgi:putative transferase (TIGR04331 family)
MKKIKKNILIISQLRGKYFEPKNSNIYFLNEGCKLHRTQKHYKYEKYKNNFILNFNYKLDSLNKDLNYLLYIYELFLEDVSKKLNQIHEINYPKSYWRVVIGPWLFEFLSILFDNWKKIKFINANSNIIQIKIANTQNKNFSFKDNNDFSFSSLTDEFNNQIFKDLLFHFKKFKLIYFNPVNSKKKLNITNLNFIKLISNLSQYLFFFLRFSLSKNFFFFYSSYLPKKISFYLQIKLKQIPIFPKFFFSTDNKKENLLRAQNFSFTNDNFLNLAKDLLFKYMPLSYLENFKNISAKVKNIYSIKPKIIFSSSAFINDDYFKIWLADINLKKESKFISGQHGGYFYIGKFIFDELHQEKISDKIITWGYHNRKIHSPLFNFKIAHKKINNKKDGDLLMVNYEFSRFAGNNLSLRYFSYLNYLDDQFIFIKKLSSDIKSRLIVRPYPYSYGWNTKERFKEFKSDIFFDSNKNIDDSLKISRICYINFNSTVFLETLNHNFPTVIFFNLKQDLLRKEAIPYFNVLKKAQIFFDNNELAAAHINKVWNNIDQWWNSREVQNSVNFFCNKYTKRSSKPVSSLFNFFSNLK